MIIQDAEGKLYHTKNDQGTTTKCYNPFSPSKLYHTKNDQGTTTIVILSVM